MNPVLLQIRQLCIRFNLYFTAINDRQPKLMKQLLALLIGFALTAAGNVQGQAPSITISIPHTDICFGIPYVFTATVQNAGPAPVYQWQLNGQNVGTNSPTFSQSWMQLPSVVRCLLTVTVGGNTVTVTSNELTMWSSGEKVPEVEITASTTTICAGGTVTFTAANKSGNLNPAWEWTVNGAPAGTNSPVFTTNTLTNGAVVACRMRVPHCGQGGQGTTKDDSNPLTISVKPMTAAVAITASPTTVCRGGMVELQAKATNGGPNPTYQWKVNGTNAGTGSATFRYQPADGDEVVCMMTPDQATGCNGAAVTSNTVKLKVTDGQLPTVAISASDNNVCEGTPVHFTATANNAGTTPAYQWEVNGVKAGTNSSTFTGTNLKNGDQVVCIVSALNNACPALQASNTITLQLKPAPEVTLKPAETTVKTGAVVQLEASVTGTISSFSWSPAAALTDPQSLTPQTTPMQQTTTYRFEALGNNGCTTTKEAIVRVGTKLYLPNSFTPNGDGLNDLFRIPPGSLIELKELAVFDRWGGKVFHTTDATKGWDGRSGGKEAPAGVYVYLLSGSDDKGKVTLRGTVLLVR
jgi:gliding motility-associated-like protein